VTEENMIDQKQKDAWDKARILGSILGSIAIPVVLLLIGQILSQSNQRREEAAQSLQLAIEVLRDTPRNGDDVQGLRRWAFETLNKNLQIPLPDEIGAELLTKSLPGAAAGETTVCGQQVESPCGSCRAAPGNTCCVTCAHEPAQN
jgi:hypothetical protein